MYEFRSIKCDQKQFFELNILPNKYIYIYMYYMNPRFVPRMDNPHSDDGGFFCIKNITLFTPVTLVRLGDKNHPLVQLLLFA